MSDSGPRKGGGRLAGIIADEQRPERRDRPRLFAWGFCAVLAVAAVASLYRSPDAIERSSDAAHLLESRAAHAERLAAENGLEARRLAAAIATLNSDRDRLFSRLASLETSLETATDSLRKMEAALVDRAPPETITAPAAVAAAASPRAETGETTETATAAAEPPVETTATIAPAPVATEPSSDQAPPLLDARFDTGGQAETVAAQTEFGLELGKANSLAGLRTLWRTLARKHKSELQGIGPIVAMRERRGGFDLHLVAGPIRDAATAARLCASLIDARQECRTTVFDGQRLSLTGETAPDKGKRARRKSTRAAPEPQPRPPARPSPSIASMFGLQ